MTLLISDVFDNLTKYCKINSPIELETCENGIEIVITVKYSAKLQNFFMLWNSYESD